ncbi:hypothetical protein CHUAL_009544 [Chamberlinius hualienensis]
MHRAGKPGELAKSAEFTHCTSSPIFPQSKGFVEAAVKIKEILWKVEDGYKAFQLATPLSNDFSPAELLLECHRIGVAATE